ncbi:MAG: radical SAM protein [Gemmatimonadales bacterium]|nr:radical SAM protein [Gemmatimonadales bacterium]MYG18405.1 radical SAM protein [Gemmatimonadales bacterium]
MHGSAPPIEPQRDIARARKIHSTATASNGAGLAAEPRADAPLVRLDHLDTLWFQVTGTICNLRCVHCFISCAPDNDSFEFLSLAEVEDWLRRSEKWGVKEYYYTGGEPFMHPDLPAMLERTLERGPASVLTNGTLLPARALKPIARTARAASYSLEMRVSLDGPSPETNDPIRGAGTFDRAMDGVRKLLAEGFLPIITATQVWEPERDEEVRQAFVARLRSLGYENPRLKILPSLRIGREAARMRPYTDEERVTEAMMEGYDENQLLCASSRVVTNRGIYACPILIETPAARMGSTLEEASRAVRLDESACYTCWLHGAICSNYGGIGQDVS